MAITMVALAMAIMVSVVWAAALVPDMVTESMMAMDTYVPFPMEDTSLLSVTENISI